MPCATVPQCLRGGAGRGAIPSVVVARPIEHPIKPPEMQRLEHDHLADTDSLGVAPASSGARASTHHHPTFVRVLTLRAEPFDSWPPATLLGMSIEINVHVGTGPRKPAWLLVRPRRS